MTTTKTRAKAQSESAKARSGPAKDQSDPAKADTDAAQDAALLRLPVAEDEDDEGAARDYVTFTLDDELFAFPMSRVHEVIRMPHVVGVPLAPASLEGLADLRGRVLPIVDLRRCCGLPSVEHNDATRVIVVDCGTALGLVVDRVAAVVSVEADKVESADSIQSTVDAEMLTAVLRGADEQMIAVLDVVKLVAADFSAVSAQAAERLTFGAGGRGDAVDDATDATTDTVELVSFVVDDQEYALPIQQVQEIVQAPETVSQVPNADDRVVGLMDLRGRLLPVVSLRRIFGLTQGPLEGTNRILVVPLEEGSGNSLAVVGLLMDTVRQVLRVPADLVDKIPGFLARAGQVTEVESVCRLEDGRRLVSVLSAERLFVRNGLRAALDAQLQDGTDGEGNDDDGNARLETTVSADSMGADGDGPEGGANVDEQLVVFRVDDEEYCVNVDTVQEIIRVPSQLVRVPKALDFVEGLVNLRGTVLPVVDLRTRLGLARAERDERQRILVLIINGVRTGFIVDAVAEVLKLPASAVEDAPELSAEQARVISKVVNLPEANRMLLVIETEELLAQSEVAALAAAA